MQVHAIVKLINRVHWSLRAPEPIHNLATHLLTLVSQQIRLIGFPYHSKEKFGLESLHFLIRAHAARLTAYFYNNKPFSAYPHSQGLDTCHPGHSGHETRRLGLHFGPSNRIGSSTSVSIL